jgi:putative transposase
MDARTQSTQHFFTAALEEGQAGSLTENVETLQLAWRACRDRYPFTLTAGVILPDHLHCIVAVPPGDRHGAARWGLLQELIQHVANGRPSGLSLEQRPLRDEAEVERHIDYIHADPLRHGWVRSLRKWPYSSLHAYIAHGKRPLHWTGGLEGSYGARVADRAG